MVITTDKVIDESPKWGKATYDLTLKKNIKSSEWKPTSVIKHSQDFVDWISGITNGYFHQKKYYLPFELYKKQAYDWLKTDADPPKYSDDYNRKQCAYEELRRIDENSFYFAEKYGYVAEGSDDKGYIKYLSKEHNAFIFFLIDCGYLLLIGKPRQIFATTTLGLFTLKRLITRYNFYMKFVTCDDNKGKEIVRDKFKFPYKHIPWWMKPSVVYSPENILHFGTKLEGKTGIGIPNSRFEQVAPSPTAINGGAPQITLIDEVGEVPELIATLFEILPTLYIDKHQDGDLQVIRQIILWGTGVASRQGKMAFEMLWTQTLSLWEAGNYQAALFVPVFLDWRCRCTQEFYDAQKAQYLSGTAAGLAPDMNLKERESLFYMHYPDNYRDMFGKMSNRLIQKDLIDKYRKKIRNLPFGFKPIMGYFEPIYDMTKPTPDDDFPYKVIDARFVPMDDTEDSEKATTWMIVPPDRTYSDRYSQGTDPIQNDTGPSFMASCIWDEYIELEDKTITEGAACYVYHRKQHDPKYSYQQCMLMGIYYDTHSVKKGVEELIESNVGGMYKDYREMKGFCGNMIYNGQLYDPDMHGGGTLWGINIGGRGNRRKSKVVGVLRDLSIKFGPNILFDPFWREHETYINIQKSEETWGPIDKRYYHDDCLDCTAYAYICRLSKRKRAKKKVEETKSQKKIEYRMVMDKEGNKTRKPVVCQTTF